MSPFVMHLGVAAASGLSVRDSVGGANDTLQLDQVVTLPTYESNDVVIIAIRLGAAAVTIGTPTGWTLLDSEPDTSGFAGVYYRVMGADGTTVTFTASANTRTSWVAYAIDNVTATTPFVEAAHSITTDPPSITASWGAADNLALTILTSRTSDWEATPPTNYGDSVSGGNAFSTASTRSITYGAHRFITTAAEDPDAWTITVPGSMTNTRAFTIAVRPTA